MTGAERRLLKQLVDAAQRRAAPSYHQTCDGCGVGRGSTNWGCASCRQRYHKRHRAKIDRLKAEIAERDRIADSLFMKLTEARAEISRLVAERNQALGRPLPYRTEEDRLAARRRTWRESKRRAKQGSPAPGGTR